MRQANSLAVGAFVTTMHPREEGRRSMLGASLPSNLNERLFGVAQLCSLCAEEAAAVTRECMASGLMDTLREYQRAASDCRDICRVTARVALRFSGDDAAALVTLLRACQKVCALCRDLSAVHADRVVHAADSAKICAECEDRCAHLASALRWSG